MSVLRNRIAVVLSATAGAALVLAGCAAEQPAAKEAASPKSAAPTTSGPSCNPKVGAKAPNLAVETVNGSGKVAIVPGKVTLVDFWATWCPPCKESFPKYAELYTKYKSRGFELIAVNIDDEKTGINGFVKTSGAKFPVGWDQGHVLADCWKPAGMPTAYIIDKKGVVRHIHNVWKAGDEKMVEEQIKALF